MARYFAKGAGYLDNPRDVQAARRIHTRDTLDGRAGGSFTLTTYPAANVVLEALSSELPAVLGSRLAGVYLYGSLVYGGFDEHSDVDVLVVTRRDVPDRLMPELQAMHERIAKLESWCATQLEVSYLPLHALRHYDPADGTHPYLDRGPGQHIQRTRFGPDWVIQRSILRARSLRLYGPDPRELIDPVSPGDLRVAMRALLNGRLAALVGDPSEIDTRGYQSYFVLTVCRVLYTLEHGSVLSKPAAAEWGKATLDPRWGALIEHAIRGRQSPDGPPDPDELAATLAFIGYALERSHLFR